SKDFLAAIESDISDVEFYAEIGKYLSSFNDAHVGFSFPSTAISTIHLEIREFDNKFYIYDIFDPSIENIHIGDEVLEMDGTPTAETRDELLLYLGKGNEFTSKRIATRYLTYRRQEVLPFQPNAEEITLRLKPQSGGEPYDATLKWHKSGYEFAEFNDPGIDLESNKALRMANNDTANAISRYSTFMYTNYNLEPEYFIGYTTPILPLGATFVERKTAPYYSGVIQEEGKRIGFLRIHTYSRSMIDLNKALDEMEEEISYFEETTDALIIDQTANPGGDGCHVINMASLFMDKPFKAGGHRIRANRTQLNYVEKMLQENDLSPENEKAVIIIIDKIREAMATGELLTEPLPLCGFSDTYDPYITWEGKQINYTKPVLVLIDELSASGGDLFPAIMQDNNRATLFGHRTVGAGGAVEGFEQRIGYSEITFRYTIGMLWRDVLVDIPGFGETNYLENTGVWPEIEYKITYDDFMSDFQFYRDAMIEAVLSLIDNKVKNEEGDE
ncbi:MAG: PDZ domain-containing protein, partial [Deltaproteobacteria bacterium]|nr:PDZ domain-containing protein [Deltaproteobacteria bacterium]